MTSMLVAHAPRLLFLACLLPALAGAADSAYVQSVRAPLLERPVLDAKPLAELPRGTRVEVLAGEGAWRQVDTGSQRGWVSRLLLAPRPPLARVSVLEDADAELGAGARRRASAVSTAGAARGLAAEARRRDDAAGRTDYRALRRLEAMEIQPAELERFLAEGFEEAGP